MCDTVASLPGMEVDRDIYQLLGSQPTMHLVS
jgi:hypothetical protein